MIYVPYEVDHDTCDGHGREALNEADDHVRNHWVMRGRLSDPSHDECVGMSGQRTITEKRWRGKEEKRESMAALFGIEVASVSRRGAEEP